MYHSQLSVLADQVGTLLRHDNIAPECVSWLNMAMADIVQKSPSYAWVGQWASGISIGDTTFTADISADLIGFRNTLALVVCDDATGSGPEAPENSYVVPRLGVVEFMQRYYGQGAAPSTGRPKVYTIKSNTQSGGTVTIDFEFYPAADVAYDYVLFYIRDDSIDEVTSDYGFPYFPAHGEHVLILGAAAIGAKAMRQDLYPYLKAEYDQAATQWLDMMAFTPDKIPHMQGILPGPYATTRLGAPKFPENIG